MEKTNRMEQVKRKRGRPRKTVTLVNPNQRNQSDSQEFSTDTGDDSAISFDELNTTDKAPQDRPKSRGRPKVNRDETLVVEMLQGVYGLAGLGLLAFDMYDGSLVMSESRKLAESAEQLARRNDALYKMLVAWARNQDITLFVQSHGKVTTAILARHRFISPTIPALLFKEEVPVKEPEQEPAPWGMPGTTPVGTNGYTTPYTHLNGYGDAIQSNVELSPEEITALEMRLRAEAQVAEALQSMPTNLAETDEQRAQEQAALRATLPRRE